MGKIHLTANIDLKNYEYRISDIVRTMKTPGIEIMSLPENFYANSGSPYLSLKIAEKMAIELKNHDIAYVQFHYPVSFQLHGYFEQFFYRSLEFCSIIKNVSGAQVTLNYHNDVVIPHNIVKDGEARAEQLNDLEKIAKRAALINQTYGSPCLLVVENNGVTNASNNNSLRYFDMVAEDYEERDGIEGNTFDISHAWRIVHCFKKGRRYKNLEWCMRQYNGVPDSAKSLENFIKRAAKGMKWIHLADEDNMNKHQARHIGEGKIDFVKCLRTLSETTDGEIIATIEVDDGHTPDGFRKILESDYPKLSEILKN